MRSKWKRKCRTIKRERYAVKELARLKKMLGISEENKPQSEVMEADEEQVIFLNAAEVKGKSKKNKHKKPVPDEGEDIPMSSDDEKIEVQAEKGEKRIFSSKTMKDQNGAYPVWLHNRKKAKLNKGQTKKIKKRTKKRGKR